MLNSLFFLFIPLQSFRIKYQIALIQFVDPTIQSQAVTLALLILQSMVTTLCNEKSDWAENTSDATTHDFITQKQALDDAMEPIWAKLNEPGKDIVLVFCILFIQVLVTYKLHL